MKKITLALLTLLALNACNTFEGLGTDIGNAGNGLSNTARNVKEKI